MDFPRDPTKPTLSEFVELMSLRVLHRMAVDLPGDQHREALRALCARLLEESHALSEPPGGTT